MGELLAFTRDDAAQRLGYYRRRFAVVVNTLTGKAAVIDLFEQRLALMRRRVHGWASVVKHLGETMPLRLVMVDLTYSAENTYQAGDIREYLKVTKKRLGENLVAWAWVAELQRRGEVHYHVIFAFKRGTSFPMPDKGGGWRKGSSKVQTARTPFYIVKYVGKEYQKDLARYPKGCRLYAVTVRPKTARETLRVATGLERVTTQPGGAWAFAGASVTRPYAEDQLVSRGLARLGIQSSGAAD